VQAGPRLGPGLAPRLEGHKAVSQISGVAVVLFTAILFVPTPTKKISKIAGCALVHMALCTMVWPLNLSADFRTTSLSRTRDAGCGRADYAVAGMVL
jgi:hypothetical protein